jgi:hypothetical protein
MFLNALYLISKDLLPAVSKLLIILLPFALPVFFLIAWWVIRLKAIQLKFLQGINPILLEIRLPKELFKSPAAMEIFFSYMFQSGPGNYGEAFVDGAVKPWFSCELVSIEGNVRFFVWTWKKFRNLMEAQLYAEFPNIEILEAEDYAKNLSYSPDKQFLFGIQYALTKADPYPIKTYVDYGLDKNEKDEYKVDPINAVLEYLGTMKKGEVAGIQILIQKHEKEGWTLGRLFEKPDWKKAAADEIKKLREGTVLDLGEGSFKMPNPTKGQMEVINAIERSVSKVPFDCMVRGMYLAEKDKMNPYNISGVIGCMRQYSSNTLNGFKPGFLTSTSDLQKDLIKFLPWIFKNKIEGEIEEDKEEFMQAYKLRSYFQTPFRFWGSRPQYVLNTEELATIFHFPSSIVSQTPTLTRVPSKKSEAPSNLPI